MFNKIAKALNQIGKKSGFSLEDFITYLETSP